MASEFARTDLTELWVASGLPLEGSVVSYHRKKKKQLTNVLLRPSAANAYFNGIAYPSSPYDWGYYTSNQTDLDSREVFWPRGKLLGGSSAVNGVYMTRASEGEHNAWASLYNSTTWDFPNVLPYYKKVSVFRNY